MYFLSDKSPIRLLVVSSVWPHMAGSFEAANVVSHAIVSELAQSGRFAVSYAYINTSNTPIPANAKPEIEQLKFQGVRFLDPLLIDPCLPLRQRPLAFLKALFFQPSAILAGYGASAKLQILLAGQPIDAVISIWSEIGLNAAADFPALRLAYHGNPDYKVFDAQHEVMKLVGVAPTGIKAFMDSIRRALLRNLLKRAHHCVLLKYDSVADVAANDAHHYAQQGITAVYLQNMWPMTPPFDWEIKRDKLESANPGKIIGSVGNMSATGNSLGFIALGQEVLPALKRKLSNVPFEIHIFGGREPKAFLKPLLNDPHIKIRGFVDDLDGEILSAPIFLISNNHHTFKVGHTRFLHAWSLGACVVAFADCREAMPEIEHNRNALLGNTAEEIASLVTQALADRTLRRRIAKGGIETLQTIFSPKRVTHILSANIQSELDKQRQTL